MTTLAVDCMGGDHGPRVTLPPAGISWQATDAAAVAGRAAERLARVRAIRALRDRAGHRSGRDGRRRSRWRCAARKTRRCGWRSAGQGRPTAARPAVSAGNTGALMALARYVLKTLDGIDRPAIATALPNAKGGGAHHGAGPGRQRRLHRPAPAAVRRHGLARWFRPLNRGGRPTVGLLNIGEEAIKGSEIIKKAGELLRAAADSAAT